MRNRLPVPVAQWRSNAVASTTSVRRQCLCVPSPSLVVNGAACMNERRAEPLQKSPPLPRTEGLASHKSLLNISPTSVAAFKVAAVQRGWHFALTRPGGVRCGRWLRVGGGAAGEKAAGGDYEEHTLHLLGAVWSAGSASGSAAATAWPCLPDPRMNLKLLRKLLEKQSLQYNPPFCPHLGAL